MATPNIAPDIKQQSIESKKFDKENETNKHTTVKSKKVNLFRNSVKFTFFLQFL